MSDDALPMRTVTKSSPPPPPADWAGLSAWLGRWYADVPVIGVDELARWLANAARRPPTLVDIRTPAEQAVSTLPGARCVTSEAEGRALATRFPRDTSIVAYCAVGVRSARLARALQHDGCTRVFNLDGSIFAWASRGLPLVCGDARAHRVHPFDATWGRLLDPALRAD